MLHFYSIFISVFFLFFSFHSIWKNSAPQSFPKNVVIGTLRSSSMMLNPLKLKLNFNLSFNRLLDLSSSISKVCCLLKYKVLSLITSFTASLLSNSKNEWMKINKIIFCSFSSAYTLSYLSNNCKVKDLNYNIIDELFISEMHLF